MDAMQVINQLLAAGVQVPAICQKGTQVLHQPAALVAPHEIATPSMRQLLAAMIQAMRDAPGVGLAAPQIGVGLQIFVAEDRDEYLVHSEPEELQILERSPLPLRIVFNPVLEAAPNSSKCTFREGCLSVLGGSAEVERFQSVVVRGLDENAQPSVWAAQGWHARIAQHETDHLNGVLYLERMDASTYQEADD